MHYQSHCYVSAENKMLGVITNLHYYNMILILASGAISGVWGLVLFFMKKAINRPWRIALIFTAVVSVLQALFGITLVLLGQKPGSGTGLYYLHYVYGAIVALAIPVAIAYATGGKNQRRDILIYSIAALILVAAALRALTTA
jgi:heme A synthase